MSDDFLLSIILVLMASKLSGGPEDLFFCYWFFIAGSDKLSLMRVWWSGKFH